MFDFDVLKISEEPERPVAGDLSTDGVLAGAADAGPIDAGGLRLDVRVTEIPRTPALTLSPEAGLTTAIGAMQQRARGAAVVVQNHRPVGVVTDRELLTQAATNVDDLRAIRIADVMLPCAEPLGEGDTIGTALRRMCAHRRWHLPIVCRRGLLLGALDIADISFWLRDRLTLLSVEAALRAGEASS